MKDSYNFVTENSRANNLMKEQQSQPTGSFCDKLWMYLTYLVVYLSFVVALVAVIIASMALTQEKEIIQQVYEYTTIEQSLNPNTNSISAPSKPVFTGGRTSKVEHGCPNIGYRFPRDNVVEDYIMYKLNVPSISQATVCSWVETNDYQSTFTSLFSYGVGSYYNAYLIGMVTKKAMHIYIRDKEYIVNVSSANIQTKFHFCQWFSNSQRQFGLYINGVNITQKRLQGNNVLSGGGQLYIGQEQDGPKSDPQFDIQQSLHANVSYFMMWPRVLSQKEIRDVAFNCSCPGDYSIYLAADRVSIHGIASRFTPSACPTV